MYPFQGTHYLSSFIGCSADLLTCHTDFNNVVREGIRASGATLLNECGYVFENQSFTTVFLLSESHCSIHTYPEHGSVFIDLFTCGDKCDYKKFEDVLKGYLHPTSVVYSVVKRGTEHTFQ